MNVRVPASFVVLAFAGGCQPAGGNAPLAPDGLPPSTAPPPVGTHSVSASLAATPELALEECGVSAPVRIETGGATSGAPTLAWNGCGFGLLWAEVDHRIARSWRFARLDREGLRLAGTALPVLGGEFWEPGNLVWTGGQYVATVIVGGNYFDPKSGPGVQFFDIDAAGAVITGPRLLAHGARTHSLSWTGTDIGFAWGGGLENVGSPDIEPVPLWMKFQRIDSRGDPLTPEVGLEGGERFVRMSAAGDGFALTWGSQESPKRHLRLGPDGVPVGNVETRCCEGEALDLARTTGAPAVAGMPGGSMMLWVDRVPPPRPLALTVFDEVGAAVSESTASEPSTTAHPALVGGLGEVAAAWMGDGGLLFARFDEAGTRIQADTPVADAGFDLVGDGDPAASLVPTPEGYALAWMAGVEEGSGLFFARVTCAEMDALAIVCPPPVTIECGAPGGVPASDPAIAVWRAGGATSGGCEGVTMVDDAPAVFPASCEADAVSTMVTFTATDCCGNTASCESSVTVVDRTPPAVTASLIEGCLWSPNHQFVEVATYAVSDACDPGASVQLAVCSDEAPAGALGAGGQHHCPDARLGAGTIDVRAERSGSDDNGRVYAAVEVWAADACGNRASVALPAGTVPGCPGVVCVPHDQDPKSPGQTPGNREDGPCEATLDAPLWQATSCDTEAMCP